MKLCYCVFLYILSIIVMYKNLRTQPSYILSYLEYTYILHCTKPNQENEKKKKKKKKN